LEIGVRGHGIVRNIVGKEGKEVGMMVQTIGGVYGFVPKSKIAKSEAEEGRSLKERYPVGVSVEFKVLEVDKVKMKAIFTLDVGVEDEEQVSLVTEKNKKKRKTEDGSDSNEIKKKKQEKGRFKNIICNHFHLFTFLIVFNNY
jgi:S1 RNA binding family protein